MKCWMDVYCCLECVWMVVAGWTVARPNVLAQATWPRLGETCRNRPKLALELSLKRRAFVWVRHHLAQTREACLSEDAWGLEVCCCMCSSSEEPLFGRGVFSSKQVAARLSENPRVSQGSLMIVSPKRDPVAWERLARDFTIELFLSCFWVVNCMFGLVCFTLSMNCINWVTLYE